jgi:hypothetical protein
MPSLQQHQEQTAIRLAQSNSRNRESDSALRDLRTVAHLVSQAKGGDGMNTTVNDLTGQRFVRLIALEHNGWSIKNALTVPAKGAQA